ncbi:protein CLAVATA 3 [Punica granatum]|uniref:Uncharacterized protein n=2 Tax=Punica granatum TaxID=22663 RepID=A0A218W830_PUNGR|nr:protein CLAVATA 3 [Punica granatum]OWM69037.1 hypothetical protein CDL15_Pgr025224 [Punica granatum]PKI73369.1 hypothetical protein CRG98_006307 [Punica granatum]
MASSAALMAVCLLLLGASTLSAPLTTVSIRKVLVAVEDPPLVSNAIGAVPGGIEKSEGGGEMVESELRRVPSGPDPLHHHGSAPKKPDNRKSLPQTP